MTALADVQRHVDRERLVKLLVEAVDTYSPSHAEESATAVFAEALNEAGIPHLIQSVPGRMGGEERGNLIVEMGPRPVEMLWVGHVDTIPIIDEEKQKRRRRGDLLFGLGTADMKGGCAAAIEAVVALAASGAELQRGLGLALVVGEEEYGDGSQALLGKMTAPLTVIGEPTGLVPCTEHWGYLEYRLSGRGNEAHAALPEFGASAIHAMLTWLTHALEEARKPPFAGSVASNPREITGGGDLFLVARRCEALLDLHVSPGVSTEAIAALIDNARSRAVASHPDCDLHAELVYAAKAYALEESDPMLTPLRNAFAGVGLDWRPGAFRSHSDGSMFYEQGCRPVVCGPGRLEVAHTRDEHVSLDEVEQAARLYAAMFHEACATPGVRSHLPTSR